MNALTAAENDRRASRARHYHSAPRGTERMLAGSLLGLMLLVGASSVHAQARGDGARTYWKKPVDTHAVTTTFQINTGNVGFNTDLPITGAVIESTVFIASYTAYFGLLGRTNMVTLALPAGTMSGHTTGVSPVAVDIATKGRADPVLSWDINLIGGPAMDVREFASYRQRTVRISTSGSQLRSAAMTRMSRPASARIAGCSASGSHSYRRLAAGIRAE